jgi:hypothetical protein
MFEVDFFVGVNQNDKLQWLYLSTETVAIAEIYAGPLARHLFRRRFREAACSTGVAFSASSFEVLRGFVTFDALDRQSFATDS